MNQPFKTPTEKNLLSLVILLVGLFVGSLFVDLTQLSTGSGFSGRVAREHNVLEGRDKTWVAYDDPKVVVDLVTEADCATCNADEALVWLRRVLPTLEVREIEAGSAHGQALIERFHITAIPALVFSQSLEQTDFYPQAQVLFTKEGDRYYFRMADLGLSPGKYLELPTVHENDIAIGNPNASVTVIEYSDFQCPYCQTFHADLMSSLSSKTEDVYYVFKNLPLINVHNQSLNAALASECAHEQGKFAPFSDILFSRQTEWAETTGTSIFKVYAIRSGVNGRTFAACLDGQKYLEKLHAIRDEAVEFGITGTPATFVNDAFLKGALPKESIEQTLSQELGR